MKRKLLLVDIPEEWCDGMLDANTAIETGSFGPELPHMEYQFYEHVAVHNLVERAVNAEKEGFDAIVLGCFYDSGLRELRELLEIPVVGVGESSLHLASMLCAGKFSVLVGRRKWIPRMSDNARGYGVESKIASWRVLDLTVPEMDDREKSYAAIIREAAAAVEVDQAEAVILGCTGLVGHARRAQEELGIPVLDPVLAGVKMAELRADLWKQFGISHSKIGGYETPPAQEFDSIFKAAYGHE